MTRKKSAEQGFIDGAAYINAYFLKVDASGHSSVVSNNPHDKADLFFDLVEDAITDVIRAKKRLYGCANAEFWGWQGDGGLCVFHDDMESAAGSASVDVALQLIDRTLPALQDDLVKLGILGSLGIRVAVHKGSFKYKEKNGSIHSSDLNFVCHLEARTPVNTVSLTDEVYRAVSDDVRQRFLLADFNFQGKRVYFYSSESHQKTSQQWAGKVPISGSVMVNMFTERPTQYDKAMLIKNASQEVFTLGTALSTCSQYLVSKEKPGYYKEVVKELLSKGVNYYSYVLDPESEFANIYSSFTGEDIQTNVYETLARMQKFADDVGRLPGEFQVFSYNDLPRLACIAADRNAEGLLIVTPYTPNTEEFKRDRADTLHYLLTKQQDLGLYKQVNEWMTHCETSTRTKRLI